MPNSQTAFFPQLENYITKYVVPRPIPLTSAETAEQPFKCAEAVAALFEQFLLFDHLAIRISNYTYFTLLTETAGKLAKKLSQAEAFTELGRIENFPDLKTLFSTLANPFPQMAKLRGSARSRRFREWLANTNGGSAELTAEYIAAIAGAKGALDTNSGKFIKAIAMTAISGGLLAGVGGAPVLCLGRPPVPWFRRSQTLFWKRG